MVSTTGPVTLVAQASGYIAVPERQVVPPGVDRVEVEFIEACRIALTVVEAGTRKPPFASWRIRVVDLATGRPPRGTPDDLRSCRPGLDAVRHVLPGVYAVTVEAEGYGTWRAERVELPEPAADGKMCRRTARAG